MKTEYKYIYFENKTDGYAKRKTQVWWIISKRGSGWLGVIKWFARWRQYCFFPFEHTVYSVGCMNDIIDFIDQLNEKRKNIKKESSTKIENTLEDYH